MSAVQVLRYEVVENQEDYKVGASSTPHGGLQGGYGRILMTDITIVLPDNRNRLPWKRLDPPRRNPPSSLGQQRKEQVGYS